MRGESELLCGHSHGESDELGQVEHGDVVSEVLLGSIELEVAERADIDDELSTGCLHVLQVGLGELLGDISECGLESSSCTAAEHLVLPGHALGTGGLNEVIEDDGPMEITEAEAEASLK